MTLVSPEHVIVPDLNESRDAGIAIANEAIPEIGEVHGAHLELEKWENLRYKRAGETPAGRAYFSRPGISKVFGWNGQCGVIRLDTSLGIRRIKYAMRLPNGERAQLGTKLEDYVLNPLHPHGKHKALRFERALGITLTNAGELRQALLDAATNSDEAEPRGDNGFGQVFLLRFPVSTLKGTATVLSVWIVRHGEDFPRLTTCYIV